MTVIGMGNPEMGDDGVGVRLAQILEEEIASSSRAEEVKVVLAGVDPVLAGASVAEEEEVLILDAVDMKRAPGEWRVFTADDADFAAVGRRGSSHSIGLAEVIEMARGLGRGGRLRIFGVQIGDARRGVGLSPGLRRGLPRMLQRIREEVGLLP